jgi:hypothetical protein
MWSVLWTNTNELTCEILGIRPLLIDKLSNYCVPKDGVLLPRMDSYSSVLPLIVDPFIIKGCNYCGLRCSILIIEAEAGDSRAWGLYLATLSTRPVGIARAEATVKREALKLLILREHMEYINHTLVSLAISLASVIF